MSTSLVLGLSTSLNGSHRVPPSRPDPRPVGYKPKEGTREEGWGEL